MVQPKKTVSEEGAQLLSALLMLRGIYTVSAVDAKGKNKQHIISQNESLNPDLIPPPATTFRKPTQREISLPC